jgi:hypothetical protein
VPELWTLGGNVASSRKKDFYTKHNRVGVYIGMNHKPFIVAICLIIAVGIVLIMASGSGGRVSPAPGSSWTLTYSIPASNRTVAMTSGSGALVAPTPRDSWMLTFSIPASNRTAAFPSKSTPQTK